jgi:hypothetical protein
VIGLTIFLIKKTLWLTFASLDFVFILCTLGTVDPKTRRPFA